MTVTATADTAVTGDQTVALGVSGTNLTAGDYTLSNSTITILNGATTGSVTFTIVNDGVVEGEEFATLTISSPSTRLILGATTARTVSIVDSFKASILGFDTAITFTEGDAPILLDTDVTVTDVDSANFNTGSMRVFLNAALEVTDRLEIRNQGTGAGQIGVSGANVTFGGPVIGTCTGGFDAADLVISFNANATPAAAQALARNLTYRNVSEASSGAQRVVRICLNDGQGSIRTVHKPINIVPVSVNEQATVLGFDTAITQTGLAPAILLDVDVTVTDVDSDNFDTGSMMVYLNAAQEMADRLEIRHQGTGAGQIGVSGANVTFGGVLIGTVTGGADAVPLTISFNANATPAAAQALARNLTFRTVSADPSTAPRVVRIALNDGDGATRTVHKMVNVLTPNRSATIAGFDTAITYTEGDAPLLLDADVTVTDADSPNFDTGSMTVYLNAALEATDRLEIRNEGVGAGQIGLSGANVTYGGLLIGTVTGGADAVPLTISFNANATPAAAQALARNLTFRSVSTNPSTAQRVVRIALNDGDGGTRIVSKLVNVIATP